MIVSVINIVLQLMATILLAPLVTGVIKKIKAVSQHRIGAPVLQPYYDIFKLFRKDVVIPACSSWIFRVAPYIYFLSALTAAVFIPAIRTFFSFSFLGDAILAVYILAMGRFFLALAGLDAGSTFGGMGSSREMMISSLVEPALLVSFFSIGLNPAVGSTSFKVMYDYSVTLGAGILNPVHILVFMALLIILLAETARIPVDDPATHLELTMVHEAMILDYSGHHLALIQLASSVKQLVFINLIVNLFIPFGNPGGGIEAVLLSLGLYVCKVIFTGALVGLIEINTVKLRLFSVPNLAALAFIFSMLAFMSGFVFGR